VHRFLKALLRSSERVERVAKLVTALRRRKEKRKAFWRAEEQQDRFRTERVSECASFWPVCPSRPGRLGRLCTPSYTQKGDDGAWLPVTTTTQTALT
jgi:hypothetical protein